MSINSRDFYHIQDKLYLAWQHSSRSGRANDPLLAEISKEIEVIAQKLIEDYPDLQEFIDLTNKKIALLERGEFIRSEDEQPVRTVKDALKQCVEVSLSSSGMGFFSEDLAEEDAQIDLSLALDTVNIDIEMTANVLECRRSADAENPGYWIRVRFLKHQDQKIDQLLAHVTQRQIEKLQRKTSGQSDTQTDAPSS